MARSVEIRFNAKRLEESMRRLSANYPQAIEPALFDAGNRMLQDAIYQAPMAPKRKGFLRRSARTEPPRRKGMAGFNIAAGFNIVYAARWHEISEAEEAKINWTTNKGAPDPGRKYLESKLARFGDEYLEIIGGHMRQFIDRGGV